MKKVNIIVLGFIGLTFSCSNPNKEFIEKIKQQVKEDAMGVEMNYKNIDFQWTDTLFVKEKLSSIEADYSEKLNEILELEYHVKDNFEKGKIFSISYLTKERFDELRNWELKVGHPNQYSFGGQATWVKNGYKDYYEFAFDNRDLSAWVSELCDQIEQTDELLSNYENLEEGNLNLIQNALWFYNRIDEYWSNGNPNQIWTNVSNEIEQLKSLKSNIDSLSSMNSEQVIYFKALNTYKINNPFLNGAEQELKNYFLFDSDLKLIGREDLNRKQ